MKTITSILVLTVLVFFIPSSWAKEPKGGLTTEEVEAIVEKKLEEKKIKVTDEGLTLSSEFWKVSFGGLLQAWYQFSDDAPNATYGFTNANSHNIFRLRRSEIKFAGAYKDKLKFTVMIDPAKNLFQNQTLTDSAGNTVTVAQPRNDDSILQDVVLSFKYIPYHEVQIGQYKTPLGLEGLESSAKLAFAERAIMSRTLSDRRDIGLMVTGKPIDQVQYQIGVFNGEGPNELDRRDFKDIGGRITVKPIKGLHFGGAYYRGRIGDPEASNYRAGGEFRYEFKPWFFQAEFMRGFGGGCGAGITCMGSYGYVGDDIWKGEEFTVQALGRFEWVDLNRAVGNNIQYVSTAGFNLLLPDYHAKIQLNVTETELQGPGRNSVFFLAVQFAL